MKKSTKNVITKLVFTVLVLAFANTKVFALFPYLTGFTSFSPATQTVVCAGTPTAIVSNWTNCSNCCGNADLYDVNWYRNTVNSTSGGTLIYTQTGVAVSTTYTLPSGNISTIPGTSYYYVVVSFNAGNPACLVGGSPAVTATVTINGTIINTQPTAQNTCAGGSATFSVAASSSSGITYQWQVSTDGGVTWGNISNVAPYSGVTTASMTASGASLTAGFNGYQYRCVVTGACTPINSSAAVLSVNVLALTSASAVTICAGQSSSFSIIASTGQQWQYYNGATWNNVVNGTPANFTYTNATTATLNIATTAAAANGNYQYRCNATACSLSLTSPTATLTLGPPAAGSITPLSTSGACGSLPSFTLTLGGGYGGGIQWQSSSDGVTWYDILGETSNTYSGTASATTYYRTIQTNLGCTSTQASVATVTVTGLTAETYTGLTNGAWTTATNWSGGYVPTTCTDVTIPTGKNVNIAAGAYPTTVCHNLLVQSGASTTVQNSTNNYLWITGNLTNNGTMTQTSASTALTSGPNAGRCNACSGYDLAGYNTTWDGTGTYPIATITIEDNSNTTMVHDASIDFLNCTKTTIVGKLNLGSKTLGITNVFAQAGSEVHVNTGLLWIQIQSSMLIDQSTLYPEYGTCWWDLPGFGWTVSGGWATIGGTGFYNFWERVASPGSITNNCAHHCRGDYKVYAGGTISFGAGGGFTNQIEGDFINEGTFTHGSTNIILMDGPGLDYNPTTNTYTTSTLTQNITGPSTTTFNKLTIANTGSAGVTLNGVDAIVTNSVTTNSALTLTSGPLFLNSRRLTVTNPQTIQISRASGYVVSENNAATNPSILQWNIGATTGAHIFPFGTVGGSYIPVTFNNSGNSGNISISTRPTATSDNTPWATGVGNMYDGTVLGDGSVPAVIDRWWDITPSIGSPVPAVTLSLSYVGAENTLTVPTDILVLQHWNGSVWDNGNNGGSGTYVSTGTAGTTAGGPHTVAAGGTVTYFSPYLLSRLSAPLPITLTVFTATYNTSLGDVELDWSTASEANNSYFTVERTQNGVDFETVGIRIPGNGTTSQVHSYTAFDEKPYNGISYYRLKQTDFNGNFSYSPLRSVNVDSKFNDLSVFPNPSSSSAYFNFTSEVDAEASLRIFDAMGNLVFSQPITVSTGGNSITVDVSQFAKGFYFATLNLNGQDAQMRKTKFARE